MPTYTSDLLTIDNDGKTPKGRSLGYLTGVLYLAPSTLSGFNVCQKATAGCAAGCLYYSGRGYTPVVQEARLRRTKLLFSDKEEFLCKLYGDLYRLRRYAEAAGMKPAARLNGTSDLPWERVSKDLFRVFHDVTFYDYTKVPGRHALPPNYHLTFSASETNTADCREEWKAGRSIALVHDGSMSPGLVEVPWASGPVRAINGDIHDCRFLEMKQAVVLLSAKGEGKKDTTGFVHREV